MESLEQIAEQVRLATGFDVKALRSKNRDVFRVAARQLFCYYARVAGYTSGRIGGYLLIDHATVLYSANQVVLMKETDRIIKEYVKKYEIMSNRKQIIEIMPSEYDFVNEHEIIRGFACPTCTSRGFNIDRGIKGDNIHIACPRCEGTGRLRATVMINWEADV